MRLPAKICTLLITRQLLCVMVNAFSRLYQTHSEGRGSEGRLGAWRGGFWPPGAAGAGPPVSARGLPSVPRWGLCYDQAPVGLTGLYLKDSRHPEGKAGKPAPLGRAKGLGTARISGRGTGGCRGRSASVAGSVSGHGEAGDDADHLFSSPEEREIAFVSKQER